MSPLRHRRLRSKTPSLADSPAGSLRRGNVTTQGQCDEKPSPKKRRLVRKISAEIVAASEASAVAPSMSVSTAREQRDGAQHPRAARPQARRLGKARKSEGERQGFPHTHGSPRSSAISPTISGTSDASAPSWFWWLQQFGGKWGTLHHRCEGFADLARQRVEHKESVIHRAQEPSRVWAAVP